MCSLLLWGFMKFNKRHIIEKIVIVPAKSKRIFWAKQMSIFNKLLIKFPNQEFWRKVTFSQKYDGMEYLLSPYGLQVVGQKYRDFNYKIPEAPIFHFDDNKIGSPPTLPTAPQTLKDFLSND